ncbi:MAG: chromate resistance protein ChrB domain-containing protein [Promethearchaeota archaeon]
MRWVTRAHVHVDRVACPWLIKRFIDLDAEFKFVSWPGAVLAEEDGTPFDFPDLDIPFTHHDNMCTFEVLVKHYALTDPVLQDMAAIIHSADIQKDLDRAPDARGVELTLSGLAFLGDNDQDAVQKGLTVLDALYAGLLLRRVREELHEQLVPLNREERFHLIYTTLRERLPPSIPGGSL